MKHKLLALAVSLVVAPISYMAFDNSPPYTWEGGEVRPNPAPDGAQVSVHWRMKIHRLCSGVIQRQVIDSREVVHNYDPVPAAAAQEVKTDFVVTFKLPLGMPRGPAKYRVHAAYSCNPLQMIWPIRVTTPEIIFSIEG